MQSRPRVTYRQIDWSPALDARTHELIEKLELFHQHITGCHVVIEAPAGHANHGKPYSVNIELTIPGGVINAGSGQPRGEHSDVYAALRDAFDSARRQLQNFGYP